MTDRQIKEHVKNRYISLIESLLPQIVDEDKLHGIYVQALMAVPDNKSSNENQED